MIAATRGGIAGMNQSRTPESGSAYIAVSMASLAAAFWFVGRAYKGIYHDAYLYGLQAVARLNPESVGQDIFLKFGSQDSFTLFSPFYALLVSLIGLEDAARLLTLIGHAWWLTAAWVIARKLLGTRKSWLAIAVLAGLPGFYGAWEVFQYAEPFLTPRLYAEASVLTAVACSLGNHRVGTLAFSILGVLLHPLLGFGGAVVATAMLLPERRAWLMPLTALAGLGLTCIVAIATPVFPIAVFDDDWLGLVRRRSPFLLVQDWNAESWEGVTTTLVALWILGSQWSHGIGRRLFQTATLVGLLGVLVSIIGASWLKVVLLTQGQGWRWSWVAASLIAVASVEAVPGAWQAGPIHRAALLFLFSGWLLVGWPAVAMLVIAASIWSLRNTTGNGVTARGTELVALAIAVASAYLWLTGLPAMDVVSDHDSSGRPLLTWVQRLCADGILPTVIAVTAWMLLGRNLRYSRSALLALTTSLASLAALATAPDFLQNDYQPVEPAVLDHWREVVPTDAEVYWPEDPGGAWFLLGRRNYMSHVQTAGAVFSRQAAMDMLRRSRETVMILSPAFAFNAGAGGRTWTVNTASVMATCQRSDIDFVVARHRLQLPLAAEPMSVTNAATGARQPMFLYRCGSLTGPARLQSPSR